MADSPTRAVRSPGRRASRLIGRAARGLAALILVFAGMGPTYQMIGKWRDSRRFPQRGRSFQAGRVKLNLDCSGHGSPTVILDSGLGGPALDWIRVQPEVARFAHVCSYDRAGYGWSESSPEPRTSLQIAKELRALLDSAREKAPYLLVGHSFGGYNVRLFTGLYPKDVAGVVLVDASHPDEEERDRQLLPPALAARKKRDEQRREMWDRLFTPFQTHLGIERFAIAAGWHASPYFSKEVQEEFLYLEQQTKYLEVVESEDKLFSQSGAQVRVAGNLGDRPLIVLTAGKPYEPDSLLTAKQRKKQEDLWINVLQQDEVHLSSRGRQIVVPDSSHEMPEERPDAIVSAIREVWTALQ